MRFAIIGTGFVADYYMETLENHPKLELVGAFDIDAARLSQFCTFYGVASFESAEALLGDQSVEAIVVLTQPETHYDIASQALSAGKHVYCEKPLAMDIADACSLIEQADNANLILAGAPANAYSDAFAAIKDALENNQIGQPRLVYAEMEDGAVFRENWHEWRSVSGAPWPGKHEFEIGCTLEHAGYGLSWLIGLFGSIKRITGTSATLFLDKGVDIAPNNMAPDFSTAVLEFESGVIARLTCGLCARKDRSMTIMGDDGTITVGDVWDDRSHIMLEKSGEKPQLFYRIARRFEALRGSFVAQKPVIGRRLKYPKRDIAKSLPRFPSQIDFCAGIEAMRLCLHGSGKSRRQLAAETLHETEATLVLNAISAHGGRYEMTTSLETAAGQA